MLNLALGEPLALVQELPCFDDSIKLGPFLSSALDMCVHNMIIGFLLHVFRVDLFWFQLLYLLKLLRQLRGGVNQLLLCLNNFKSIKPFLIFLQVIINIIQHMDNINNEYQSHIRYTQR